MIHFEERFAGAQGALLYMQAWLPEEPARAHLAIVHGLAEHSGRYSHLVQRGVAERYGVWGFDLRGHGRSAGKPGHINSWLEYQRDLAIFLRLIAERNPGAPRFVLGHSLGALIVLDFIETPRPDLSGAILSRSPSRTSSCECTPTACTKRTMISRRVRSPEMYLHG